jgi:ABC-type branched-subunit amino acid transport system ATPase component/ABC-type branched-subunit amino acid transport system permease subunit
LFVVVALLPLLLDDFWVGLVAEGLVFAVIFLSFTLVTGEGGMIWLCQATFAGIGGLTTAQLATNHGWPVLAAVVAGGVMSAAIGVLLGLLTIRLGDLYVALVTLTFGLLMETLVFSRDLFLQFGVGVAVPRPEFAHSDRAFTYLILGIFCVVALFVVNLRRSTTGMALNAVRWSEAAARTTGLSPLQMKVLVSGLAAFVAGVGGGLFASYTKAALPVNYATLAGVVWLAILVGLGARSTVAALVAGLTFTVFPEIINRNLPDAFVQLPTLLFGLTAIVVARHPDGALSMQGDQFRALLAKLPRRRGSVASSSSDSPELSATTDPPTQRAVPLVAASVPRSFSATSMPILEARDVTVRFGGLVALDDVTVHVDRGTIAGLVGPNGAGKSTLFAVLSGILVPQAGTVFLDRADVTGTTPQSRSRCGLARTFQHPELFLGLTVREHLVVADRAHHARGRLWTDLVDGRAWRSADHHEVERIDALLGLLGLGEVADRSVAGLPLGIARRVEVARALATSPSVVLLDEPSSGLDRVETQQLADALAQVVAERGVSMLLVEHDVEMVLGLSSTITVLDFGEVIAVGTPEEIRASATVRAAYLGDEVVAPMDDSTTDESAVGAPGR